MILLQRRNFLRALGLGAGVSVLGPLFRSWLPEAQGQVDLSKRFVVFTNGNGFVREHYLHTPRSESDFDLRPVFAPLAPFKEDLLILEEFYNPFDRALHGNQWATLSVMPSTGTEENHYRETPGGISIDRLIARELGANDPFSSIALGIEEGPNNVLCVSADGPNQKFPAIGSPVRAFTTLFGEAARDAGYDAQELLAQDRSVLDFMIDDIERMNARLAGPERAKLDQFLDSTRALERQLAGIAERRAACENPLAPDASLDGAWLAPEIVQAHVDVAFQALTCGLTRVAHVSILGMEGPHTPYQWLGDSVGHHECHHQFFWDVIERIDAFVLSQVARMFEHLRSFPEGNGTMADRSLTMYVNTCGGSHHYGQDNHAVVLVGNIDGYFRTGRYLSYPWKQHCISDVFVSVANALGLPIDSFGDPSVCQGPLPNLT